MSDEFDFWSSPDQGAVLRSVVWKTVAPEEMPTQVNPSMAYGVVSVALQGELVSGDAWCHQLHNEVCTVILADGLGHGPVANRAALAAVNALSSDNNLSLESIVRSAHDMSRSTVGSAVGVARFPSVIRRDGATVSFAGVGNISASVWANHLSKHLPSHDGVVGHTLRRVQQFDTPCPADSIIVLHSDGLKSRWDLARYAGLASKHPSLIAAILYRDFSRTRDDVTIFVARVLRSDEVMRE